MAESIKFYVNEVAGGWSPTDKRLGGTEESVVQWAERIAPRVQKITVYQNGFQGVHNGVQYRPREEYEADGGVTICIKDSSLFPLETTYYLTNETDADTKDLSQYDGVIWPSEWAKNNIPVNNENIFVLPHGYDPQKIYPGEKVELSCLYASSPDRGLKELEVFWPQIVDQVPTATLTVTYGGDVNLPRVLAGEFDEKMMNHLYRVSDVWLHPCSGGELFGITAIKAQAAGCVPVYYPTMALSETVKHGVETDMDNFVKDTVELLRDGEKRREMRSRMIEDYYVDWDDSTDLLLHIIGVQ